MARSATFGAASPSARCTRNLALACTFAFTLLISCGESSLNSNSFGSPEVERPNPTAVANAQNFSSVVFLGDSLTAGAQNGSLLDTQQVHGYAALIAQQTNTPITQPLLAAPGVPNVMQLSLDPLGIVVEHGQSQGRDNPGQMLTNFAVPGATLADIAFNNPQNTDDPATKYILRDPFTTTGRGMSQALWAQRLQPTVIVLWAGNVEAVDVIESGNIPNLTPASVFAAQYTDLVAWFTQNTNAHLVLLNVPDVTTVPYLISAEAAATIASGQLHVDPNYFYALWGIAPQDYLNATGLQLAIEEIENPSLAPLPSSAYLTPAEISVIQSTVTAYNQAIAQQAAAVNATLVDMHAGLLNLAQNGTTINGTPVTFQYLGGVFSLDGVHPSNTGYALVANMILQSLNSSLKTSFPLVDVGAIAAVDPLFPANMSEQPYIPFLQPRGGGRGTPVTAKIATRRSPQGGFALPPGMLAWRDQARSMEIALRHTLRRPTAENRLPQP
jgi:lysophospholipase L1-like esterase